MHGRGRFGMKPEGKAHEVFIELESRFLQAQDGASHRVARAHADVDGTPCGAVLHDLHARAFANRDGLFENFLFPLGVEHSDRRGGKKRQHEKTEKDLPDKTLFANGRWLRFRLRLRRSGFDRVGRIGFRSFRILRLTLGRRLFGSLDGGRLLRSGFLFDGLFPRQSRLRLFGRRGLHGRRFFGLGTGSDGVGRIRPGRPLFPRNFGTGVGLGRSGFGRSLPGRKGICGPEFVVAVGWNLVGHG